MCCHVLVLVSLPPSLLLPRIPRSLLVLLLDLPVAQEVVSHLQYSSCRIERIFLVHILHALFGSAAHMPARSRTVRSQVIDVYNLNAIARMPEW